MRPRLFQFAQRTGSIATGDPLIARLRRKLGGGFAPRSTSCEPRGRNPLAAKYRGRRESLATQTGG